AVISAVTSVSPGAPAVGGWFEGVCAIELGAAEGWAAGGWAAGAGSLNHTTPTTRPANPTIAGASPISSALPSPGRSGVVVASLCSVTASSIVGLVRLLAAHGPCAVLAHEGEAL